MLVKTACSGTGTEAVKFVTSEKPIRNSSLVRIIVSIRADADGGRERKEELKQQEGDNQQSQDVKGANPRAGP